MKLMQEAWIRTDFYSISSITNFITIISNKKTANLFPQIRLKITVI